MNDTETLQTDKAMQTQSEQDYVVGVVVAVVGNIAVSFSYQV